MSRNVLFLCTGNSSRSILAEAILNQKGRPNFTAYSAGSHPTGCVNPYAIKQLEMARLPVANLRSKSWDEFAKSGAPEMDFVFTVCDSAANEICPVWPGQPITAHWGIPDPGSVVGSTEEIERAFRDAFVTLDRRIGLFLSLRYRVWTSQASRKKWTGSVSNEVAHCITGTFAGIRPHDVAAFVLAQIVGASAAFLVFGG
jgi:arsenate reductase